MKRNRIISVQRCVKLLTSEFRHYLPLRLYTTTVVANTSTAEYTPLTKNTTYFRSCKKTRSPSSAEGVPMEPKTFEPLHPLNACHNVTPCQSKLSYGNP